MTYSTLTNIRNTEIQNIYKRILKSAVNINSLNNDAIVSIVLEQPAPRFYISPGQAETLISNYYNMGCTFPDNKRTIKQEMTVDLVANYERLRNRFPHTPKDRIYEMVVEQPAKSFYITHRNMRDIIFNYNIYGRRKK